MPKKAYDISPKKKRRALHHKDMLFVSVYTCRESNPNLRNRNPLFYPLKYRCPSFLCLQRYKKEMK